MSGLQRFEHGLSSLVEGTFARLFRGKVEPVELAAALAREADTNKAVGPQRVLVPNVYDVDLGPADFERLAPYAITLGEELAAMVREHAAEQGYTFVGPVAVTLNKLGGLSTGSFRIDSRVEAGADDEPSAAAFTPAPSPPPPTSPLAPPIPPMTPSPAASTMVIPAPQRPAIYGHLEQPNGDRQPISDRSLIIGRGQDADVRLSDSSVSRRHARISVAGGTIVVEDLGSTNGTSINGRKVTREALRIGDTLTLGTAVLHVRG